MSLMLFLTRAGLLSLITLLLASCTINHTHQLSAQTLRELKLVDQVQVHRTEHWALSHANSVYLAYPISEIPAETQYPRFRKDLALWHERQAKSFFQEVYSAGVSETLSDSRRKAQELGAQVLFVLRLERNDNHLSSVGQIKRATAFGADGSSQGRDKLFLRLQIVDVQTQRLLDTVSVYSYSGWMYWRARDSKKLIDKALAGAYAAVRLSPQLYSLRD